MKISVLTPSYNQDKYLEKCLKSVNDQSSKDYDLEHIVIDGGSTDGTKYILKEFNSNNIIWLSEKDEGQSDALNKGLNLATGEIIGWINSDDYYLEGTINKINKIFENNKEVKWIIGYCKIIDENGNEMKSWLTSYKNFLLNHYNFNMLLFEDFISQPAVFFRKSLVDDCGWIDKGLHFAMDYDLWLRFAKHSKPFILKEYLSSFRRHNTSKSETSFEIQFKEADFVSDRYTKNKLIKFLKKLNMKKNIFIYRILMR